MRWKLLAAFGGGFTVVFVVIAAWILQFSTNSATERVRETLLDISVGGAATIDADTLSMLIADAPEPDPEAIYPAIAGDLAGTVAGPDAEWPTDERYWDHVDELARIRQISPEASPYTYVRGPDGVIRFVGSWGATGRDFLDGTPDGGRFLQDIAEAGLDDETLGFFANGLEMTTEQPDYEDDFGTWISAYTPVFDSAGVVIAALGVDYPLEYVEQVRSRVVRVLYPVFGIAYIALIALVIYLSRGLTRRLSRLSAATQRVADGAYDVDLTGAAHSRFSDEMTELAGAFQVMTERVGDRERVLVKQVQVLKVEIDDVKRREAVAEITDSDFFHDLAAKASLMRAKAKGLVDDPVTQDG
jgi:HAMP domain-containing protein